MQSVTLTVDALYHSFSVGKVPCDKFHILVASFPKSGSTWLSEIISQLPDYHRVKLVPMFGSREQELTFERLLLFHGINYVAQHHCRFSEATERCLNAFSILPVVLVRNIFDCVVSVKDHLDNGVSNPDVWRSPMARIPEAYAGWSDTEKFDFIIDMMLPWYFNFFIGWREYSKGVHIAYRELLADPAATVKKISDGFGLGLRDIEIERALESASRKQTRKNVGEVGRGQALTPAQRDKIRRLASYYPEREFSPIGL